MAAETPIKQQIDSLNQQITNISKKISDAYNLRDRYNEIIIEAEGWFDANSCKWKGGAKRQVGRPPSQTWEATTGSGAGPSACNSWRNKYFNYISLRDSKITEIADLETNKDDLEETLTVLLESAEASSQLDPNVIEAELEAQKERDRIAGVEREKSLEIEGKTAAEKQKTKRRTIAIVSIVIIIIIAGVVFVIGKKKKWW